MKTWFTDGESKNNKRQKTEFDPGLKRNYSIISQGKCDNDYISMTTMGEVTVLVSEIASFLSFRDDESARLLATRSVTDLVTKVTQDTTEMMSSTNEKKVPITISRVHQNVLISLNKKLVLQKG